jgi:hypothetical protein
MKKKLDPIKRQCKEMFYLSMPTTAKCNKIATTYHETSNLHTQKNEKEKNNTSLNKGCLTLWPCHLH